MASCVERKPMPQHEKRYGLIILGNSGVGKSFLANGFLGEDTFVHKAAPSAVTKATECIQCKIGDKTHVVFNIPGLIEAEQQLINKNKIEIEKAFEIEPNSVIIYVFGNQGGRIRNEDVIAFNALNKAYSFQPKSLILVINNLPKDREKDYEGETIMRLRQWVHLDTSFQNFCFLDGINKSNAVERIRLRDQLLQAAMYAYPNIHTKQHDIQLDVDQIKKLQGEMDKMRIEFDKQKQQLIQEIHLTQQRYQKQIEGQQQEFRLAQEDLKDQFKKQQRKLDETEKNYNKQMKEQQQKFRSIQEDLNKQFKKQQKKHDETEENHKKQMQQQQRKLDLAEESHRKKTEEQQREFSLMKNELQEKSNEQRRQHQLAQEVFEERLEKQRHRLESVEENLKKAEQEEKLRESNLVTVGRVVGATILTGINPIAGALSVWKLIKSKKDEDEKNEKTK